jgi:quinol monooxygenase YgiN
MSEKIHVRAEFAIEKVNIDEFKKLIKEMSKLVESNEADTCEYQFYLNEEETTCMVHETFRNSDATIFHNNATASRSILPKIFNVAKLNKLEVYGNPSEELRNLLEGLKSQTFRFYTGFNRLND